MLECLQIYQHTYVSVCGTNALLTQLLYSLVRLVHNAWRICPELCFTC